MTPEQVKLVKESFWKILPIAGLAADLFYDRLFERRKCVRCFRTTSSRRKRN